MKNTAIKVNNSIFILIATLIIFPILFSGQKDDKKEQIKDGFIYNKFEDEKKINQYWAWDGEVALSEKGEPVYEGTHSLKVISDANWGGCGILCESGGLNISLDPTGRANQLVLWVYALPSNNSDNTLCIQFFDSNKHNSNNTKVEYWTKEKAIYGKWTKVVIPFGKLDKTLNLKSMNKIQILQYNAGTYYYDFIYTINAPLPLAEGVYQSFENSNSIGYPVESRDKIQLSEKQDPVYEGSHSLKIDIPKEPGGEGPHWAGFNIQSENGSNDIDLNPDGKMERFIFWIHALPYSGNNESIKLMLFDNKDHSADETRVEYMTKEKAIYGEWTKISVPYSELEETLNLHHIKNIRFQFYSPGTYYLDYLATKTSSAIVYHSFDNSSDIWGWAEGEKVSLSNEVVHDGKRALKVYIPDYKNSGDINYLGGCGIQSEDQTWKIDLCPEINDRLEFWVYAKPLSGFDTNFGIEMFDHDKHFKEPAVLWLGDNAVYGKWTKISIPFSKMPKTINLNQINKIQFVVYWPGTYYFDNIISTSTESPEWRRFEMEETTLRWEPVIGAEKYILEENNPNLKDKWKIAYEGVNNFYQIPRITKTIYRVSSVKNNFKSQASKSIEFNPRAVVISKTALEQKKVLEWTHLDQADLYELQKSIDGKNNWQIDYKGPYPKESIYASDNMYYRIRVLNEVNKEIGNFSPVICNAKLPQYNSFIKTDGRLLRKGYGKGDRVILRGVNIGSWLLLETWMSSMGGADNPALPDEWSVRELLKKRFGEAESEKLFKIFQDNWIKEGDLDNIMNMGMNVVRLPIYYLNLMDDKLNFRLNAKGEIDFSRIDWLVDKCADRGIYVILDLHGAPGNQNREHHSGRVGFNKLFVHSAEGEKYRIATIKLWEEIARHYKDNSNVAGYDLLNEPSGILKTYQKDELQDLYYMYDRLYKAVRVIDPDHTIYLEGAWHWQDMPHPGIFGWENVVYSFHYYGPGGNDCVNLEVQKKYFSKLIKQAEEFSDFNVPLQAGEFSPMASKASWEYLLDAMNKAEWNWVFWAYKTTAQSSTWGIYNGNEGTDYRNPATPKVRDDSFEILAKKLSHYDTQCDFHPFTPLKELIEKDLKNNKYK